MILMMFFVKKAGNLVFKRKKRRKVKKELDVNNKVWYSSPLVFMGNGNLAISEEGNFLLCLKLKQKKALQNV